MQSCEIVGSLIHPIEEFLLPRLGSPKKLKEWIIAQKETLQNGDYFFKTPYFERLIKEVEEIASTRPLVGCIIYVGPKGVGKSAIAREVNRRDGHETVLIPFHYHTAPSDLFGARPVVVTGIEQGLPIEEKIWTPGLVQYALEMEKRVVLGDITEGGPHAFGGELLDFLAARRGSKVSIGGRDYPIPEWFRVDATCNPVSEWKSANVFPERTATIYVGYPPILDELMIMAVHLTNKNGRIPLTPREQRDLVAFMVYTLPLIRQLDPTGMRIPFSLRTDEYLCRCLVDFKTGERTDLTLPEAVTQVFLQTRGEIVGDGSQQDAERETRKVASIIRRFAPFLTRDLDHIFVFPERVEKRLAQDNYFLETLNRLSLVDEYGGGEMRFEEVVLDEEMVKVYNEELATIQPQASRRSRITALGSVLHLTEKEVILTHTLGQGETYQLRSESLPIVKEERGEVFLAGASEDGQRILIGQEIRNASRFWVFSLWEEKGNQEIPLPDVMKSTKREEVIKSGLSPDGKAVAFLTQSGKLFLATEKEKNYQLVITPELDEANSFEFSPRGRLLLIRTKEETLIFDCLSFEENVVSPFLVARLKGNLAFSADGQLLLSVGENQAGGEELATNKGVQIKARLI